MIDMTRSDPPMFRAVNLPANRYKKFMTSLKFVEENADLIGKNEQNERDFECKTLEGSKFDDLIRNIYFRTSKYDLTAIHDFFHSLSKANP